VIVMDAGVIAQAGTPQDLYERPATEFVAGFMGEAMLFAGTVLEGGVVQIGPVRARAMHAAEPGPVKVASATRRGRSTLQVRPACPAGWRSTRTWAVVRS
jgi:ABC-type Fe3+/spermidine/putrescine transport system ATPase subunit